MKKMIGAGVMASLIATVGLGDSWHEDGISHSGPLAARHMHVGQWLRGLDVVPTADDTHERRVNLSVGLSWSSLDAEEPEADAIGIAEHDWMEARLMLTTRIGNQTAISLVAPFLSRSGGKPGGTEIGGVDLSGDKAGIGDMQLIVSHMTDPGFVVPVTTTFYLGVTAPTGDELEMFGSGEVGGFGGLLFERALSNWFSFHAGGQVGLNPQDRFGDLEVESFYGKGLVGLELQFDRCSFVVQSEYLTPWLSDDKFGAVADPSSFITFGGRWGILGDQTIEFAVSQNTGDSASGSDLEVHGRWLTRF